jgi:transcription initiation factor TFIIIB Brf1 subunit/transcription initiation factor TFIIB
VHRPTHDASAFVRSTSSVYSSTNDNRCCTQCGKILDDNVFSTDPTFSKTAGGASQVDGNFVPESGVSASVGRGTRGGRIFGLQVDSHEKTINKGKYEISQVADRLGIRPREDITSAAHRLYKLAVQRNFTRGRRTQQVAGACLYIVCRQESRPYMLIDFSDVVQTNVYVLGAVFLQLCRLLRLEQHPLISKPIDPSLFIHRFADKLNLNRRMHAVANTALRLVASMKRDWMQTGRRPSGVCGAALWVAALLHGFERSKRDVVAVVHVGEATLRKRVSEFENTPSAFLSVDEFDAKAKEWEKEQAALADVTRGKTALALTDGLSIVSHTTTLTCAHKDHEGAAHFAHGMCRACYVEYARVSGGAVGGEDPPAFKAAELKRKREDQANALGLPAPEGTRLALPPASGGATKTHLLLGAKKKRLTATETAEAIAAAAKAAAKHPKKDDGEVWAHTSDREGGPKGAKNARAEAFLEEEMEKALDSRGHLGEFAVMTGLRARRETSADADADPAAAPSNAPGVPTLGVGPEVAEAATALLKRLVGDAHASRFCLPLDRDGRARGRVSGKHLSSQHPHAKRDPKGVARGGRIAEADKTQLHFLLAAGCFDASAVARLKKFSKLDVDAMLAAPLPLRRSASFSAPDAAAVRSAEAAAAANAAAIRAAAEESDANHEKTRRDALKQTAREERAAKARAAELARAQGVKDPKSESDAGALATKDGELSALAETDARARGDAENSESDSDASDAEPETFSDVDDDEVADYIHSEEEVKLRRVIWSELNKEYLETQAAKEAATAGAHASARGGDDGSGAGKKKRKQYTHTVPADSAAEAAHAMLSSKKISSKINYDALNDLFKQDSLDAAERERLREAEKTKSAAAGGSGSSAGSRRLNGGEQRRGTEAFHERDASFYSSGGAVGSSGRRMSVGLGAGRLSSRLTGFNPHSKASDKSAPGLGGGGLGSRLAAAGAGAAAAAAAEKKKGKEKPSAAPLLRSQEKDAGNVSASAQDGKTEKKKGMSMSDATLAEAAMQSTGRRGGKRGGRAKGADWLS